MKSSSILFNVGYDYGNQFPFSKNEGKHHYGFFYCIVVEIRLFNTKQAF